MKLKKFSMFVILLAVAAGIVFGEYYLLKNYSSKPQYQVIIVAGQDILQGDQITIDKLSIARVDIQTPLVNVATTRNQVLGRYARVDIKKGQPIVLDEVTQEPIFFLKEGEYRTIVRIEPVPYGSFVPGDTVKLGCIINGKDGTPQVNTWDVKVYKILDANYRDVSDTLKQLNSTATTQPPVALIERLEVVGDEDTIKAIKIAERAGLFVLR